MTAKIISLGESTWVNLDQIASLELSGCNGVVTLINVQRLALLADEITSLTGALGKVDTSPARQMRQELRRAEAERAAAAELAAALRRKVQRQQADIARLTRQLAQVQAAAPAGEQVNG